MHKLQTGRGDDGDVTRCDIDTLCGNTPRRRMHERIVQGKMAKGEKERHANIVNANMGRRREK